MFWKRDCFRDSLKGKEIYELFVDIGSELKKVRAMIPGEKLPVVEKIVGKAPLQYAPVPKS